MVRRRPFNGAFSSWRRYKSSKSVLNHSGNSSGDTALGPKKTGAKCRLSRKRKATIRIRHTRPSVHFVLTEYGVVNLYGKSLKERAAALISVATIEKCWNAGPSSAGKASLVNRISHAANGRVASSSKPPVFNRSKVTFSLTRRWRPFLLPFAAFS